MLISSVITSTCNKLMQGAGKVLQKIVRYQNRNIESVPVSGGAAHFSKPAFARKNTAGSLILAYSGANGHMEMSRKDSVFERIMNAAKKPDSNVESPLGDNAASLESAQYRNVQEETEDPGYMTARQYTVLESQRESAASRELGKPQDESRLDDSGKKPQCMELKEWRMMAGLDVAPDQSDGLTSKGGTGLPASEPIYAQLIKPIKLEEPVTVQPPQQEALESVPLAPERTGQEKFIFVPGVSNEEIVEEFQVDTAHCRTDWLAANVQIFGKALNASGDELKEKVNAMETTYLESYSTIWPLSYEENSENASLAAALHKAHFFANKGALESVNALKTEDGKRYAKAWSQFAMNFGANGMPINYSLKSSNFASRPLPRLPVNDPSINKQTGDTRL